MVELMATSSRGLMPYPGLLHPEPLQEATADLYLHRRCSDTVQLQSLRVACVFCALTRSEKLRRPGAWWVHCPSWAVCLNHLPSLGHLVSWCTPRTTSQLCHISPPEGWPQAVTLLADVNHPPGSQEDVVSSCKSAHTSAEDKKRWQEYTEEQHKKRSSWPR